MRNTLSRKLVKTECTIQFEGAECGAASLSTILKYFGKYVSLQTLRKQTCVTRDGASAELIKKGALANGLDAKIYKANFMVVKEITNYPCIIFWKGSHFMVLEGIKDDFVYLSDPAHGRYRVPIEFFNQCFSKVVIELKPNKSFKADGKQQFNLTRVFDFTKGLEIEITTYFLLQIISIIPILFIAGGVSYFIDYVLQEGYLSLALGTSWMIILGAFILLTIEIIKTMVGRRIEFKMVRQSGYRLTKKLLSVPSAFYDTRFSGELGQRAMFCFDISNMISTDLLQFTATSISAIIVLIVVSTSSLILASIFLIVIAANYIVLQAMLKARMDANVSYSIVQAEARAITLQGISNIQVLKACGTEYDFVERWLEAYTESVDQTQKLAKLVAKSTVISRFSIFLINVIVFTVGAILVIGFSHMTIGSLLAIQFLLSVITEPLASLAMLNARIQVLDGALGRYQDLIDNVDDPYTLPISISPAQGNQKAKVSTSNQDTKISSGVQKLELKDLYFKYGSELPDILSDINFTLDNNEKIALIGKSGCGKSTAMKILAGLLRETSGVYKINGLTWSDQDLANLHNSIAYVAQRPNLFNGSLRDNLTLFNSNSYTDKEILDAAEITGLISLIKKIPNALDYQIQDGAENISGGQKQLVEITRAILRKPKWLLLDEATASLDVESEKNLLSNLWQLDTGIVSAAHRLRSAKISDRVYVLHQGKIVEKGKPKDLLANKESEFYKLVQLEDVS